MSLTKNAALVENAERSRRTHLTEALASVRKSIALDDISGYLQAYGPWARELNHVNQHITVPQEEIDAAAEAYTAVAHHLVRELDWPEDVIKVLPQGSASTQTLIRSPDTSKFDIDAVCQVDISRVAAKDPVGFFNMVGEALREHSAKRKKRCWNIPFIGKPFYLEFTPSVPLETVPPDILDNMSPQFMPAKEYLGTALAVVDNPTKQWKTSNPAGLTQWVDDTAKLQLIRQAAWEAASFRKAAGVAPVPDQDVEITDTLRVAIRLFKRHRDMCVRRNQIENDFKPISIIIVTLLTACYAGLADLGRTYDHPVQLLADLAELMPGMVAVDNGEFRVDNPTVPGENFAERWNEDGGERHHAFITWCDILAADMRIILAAQDEQEIQRQVRTVFGCGPDRSNPDDPEGPGGSGYTPQVRRQPPPPPRTSGLA
jgi:hypothetical protein